MYKFALLLTLSALLAACNTQAPASSQTPSALGSVNNTSSVVFKDNVAQFEAKVDADLAQLEKPGLSGQAVAPYVYLNVLKLPSSVDTVRAYFKTTYASPVTCTVNYGDGSSAVSMATPTVGRIQTADHVYTSSGSYTVIARCVNGETVVGEQSVAVVIALPVTGNVLTFDDVTLTNAYDSFSNYLEKGYLFTSQNGNGVSISKPNGPSGYGYGGTPLATQAIFASFSNDTLIMQRADGLPFTLKEFDFTAWNPASTTFTLIGYPQSGGSLNETFTTDGTGVRNPMQKKSLNSTWSNLQKVTFSNFSSPVNWHLLDNIKVSP